MSTHTYLRQELVHRRRRTLQNVGVTAVGLAVFLAMILFSDAFRQAFRAPLSDVGADLTVQRSGDVPQEMAGPVLPCSVAPLRAEEVAAIAALAGVLSVSRALVFWNFGPQSFEIVAGLDPAEPAGLALLSKVLTAGRFLRAGESGAALLEAGYARERNLSPGSRLAVAGREFDVVGLVDASRLSHLAAAQVYLGLGDARSLAAASPGVQSVAPLGPADVNQLFVRADRDRLPELQAEIAGLLGPKATVSGPDSFRTALGGLLELTDRFALAASLLGLCAAALLVLRTAAANVRERWQEIGIMKAVGWTRRDVARQMVLETLLQVGLGAAAGILLGLAAGRLLPLVELAIPIPWDMSPRPHFLPGGETQLWRQVPLAAAASPGLLALTALSALLIGLAAALVAVRTATNLKPWEAFRHE